MVDGGMLRIEVVYAASPDAAFRRVLALPAGSCVADAVRISGLSERHPDADWTQRGNVGIFGVRVDPDHQLVDLDRVEVYRGLAQHPMQARRARAARGRK